jgi:hypothetical protein
MVDEYTQQYLNASRWDEEATKRPGSAIRDVTLSMKDGEMRLVTMGGECLAEAKIAGSTASILVAGLTKTMAGVVLDFGEHKWMLDFGPVLRHIEVTSTRKKVLSAFDPTRQFRYVKRCQVVRGQFLEVFERLGGRLAEPSG